MALSRIQHFEIEFEGTCSQFGAVCFNLFLNFINQQQKAILNQDNNFQTDSKEKRPMRSTGIAENKQKNAKGS